MHFDRFDVMSAYYMYAVHWGHDDYTRAIEARLRRLRFKPGLRGERIQGLSANAKAIFGRLVRAHHCGAVGRQRFERAWRRAGTPNENRGRPPKITYRVAYLYA